MRHVHLSVGETIPRGKINVRATSWRFAPKNKVVVKTSFESMLFMNVDTQGATKTQTSDHIKDLIELGEYLHLNLRIIIGLIQ